MLNAYLGIASPAGLHALFPEHEESLVFLLRRLKRRARQRECGLWFVLPEDAADEVRRLLDAGERADALRWSQLFAHDFGIVTADSLPRHRPRSVEA
jgi:hypothetical protein